MSCELPDAGTAFADRAIANDASHTAPDDLRDSARDVWRARALLYQLALRDVRIRYKQAVMGFGWAVLMPLLVVLAGIIVRSALTYAAGGHLDAADVAAMAVKAVPWAFFVSAIGFGTTSLTSNVTLVTKVHFPREVLPLAAVLAAAFDAAIAGSALLLLLPVIGIRYSAAVIWVPVLGLVLLAFTAGAVLLIACANLFYRDVKYLVQVLLTFGIFFTPVLFEPSMFGADGLRIMMLNPLAPMLEGLRLAVVEGHDLTAPLVAAGQQGEPLLVWAPWYLAYAGAWAIGLLVTSTVVFHRSQYLFAEYV